MDLHTALLKSNEQKISLDKAKCVLKFEGDTPSFLEGKTLYNYTGIMDILNSPEWTQES